MTKDEFIQEIYKALVAAGVTEDDLDRWAKEAKEEAEEMKKQLDMGGNVNDTEIQDEKQDWCS